MNTDAINGASMMLCRCPDEVCGNFFLVFTNYGHLSCPHCRSRIPEGAGGRVWGTVSVRVVFKPEEPKAAKIIPIDPSKRDP